MSRGKRGYPRGYRSGCELGGGTFFIFTETLYSQGSQRGQGLDPSSHILPGLQRLPRLVRPVRSHRAQRGLQGFLGLQGLVRLPHLRILIPTPVFWLHLVGLFLQTELIHGSGLERRWFVLEWRLLPGPSCWSMEIDPVVDGGVNFGLIKFLLGMRSCRDR